MSINGTYILLQKQIADECADDQQLLAPLSAGSGLLSPIQNAIQSAIAKWERVPFYFNGYRLEPIGSAFNLIAGQEFYSAQDFAPLSTLARIINIRFLQGAQNRYATEERDVNYLNDLAVNASWRGLPTDHSYDQAQLLRIYPIPDVNYPAGIVGTQRFTPLAKDGDQNCWTTDAWDLIKSEAKLILAREVIFDAELEANMEKAIYGNPDFPGQVGYLKALKDETTRRTSQRSRIRPTNF